jgi:hypothetical protein
MKKKYVIFLLTGALLGACSSNDVETSYEQEVQQFKNVPVTFGTYIGNSAETRANTPGVLDLSALKAGDGFGVFAIYTNDKNLATDGGKKPNFMYNEHVTWDASAWTYSPIKYWPNEFGSSAQSAATDMLSFFAYAPWSGNDETGNEWDKSSTSTATGIVKLTTKTETSKYPTVTYRVANTPAQSVDLLYAKVQDATKPLVAIDADGSKVKFDFKHALARFGLQVQGVFDSADATNPGTKDAATNIKLEEVEVTIKSASKEADFDLQAQTWGNLSTGADYVITVGATDIADDLKSENTTKGVTQVAANVIKKDNNNNDQYFMLIPQSKKLSVKVTYTVTTTDPAVDGGKAVVQNVITKETAEAVNFEMGKSYNLKLLLGMRTVKMEVTSVEGWPTTTDLSPLWVPVNVTP